MKFTCVRKSYANGHLYTPGDEYVGEKPPSKHFKPAREVEEKQKKAKEENEKKIEELQMKLDKFKKPYDKRWGVERLEQEVIKAEKLGAKPPEPKKDK